MIDSVLHDSLGEYLTHARQLLKFGRSRRAQADLS
jgi:hypothetical protein